MSSQDTLHTADAERQKANDLEAQAKDTLDTARNQAQRLLDRAKAHNDQASKFTQNAAHDHQNDMLNNGDAERQEAANLEAQAQGLLDRAQQEADGMRKQAHTHLNEADRLTQQSQQEQKEEAKQVAEAAREEQKRHDKIKDILF